MGGAKPPRDLRAALSPCTSLASPAGSAIGPELLHGRVDDAYEQARPEHDEDVLHGLTLP